MYPLILLHIHLKLVFLTINFFHFSSPLTQQKWCSTLKKPIKLSKIFDQNQSEEISFAIFILLPYFVHFLEKLRDFQSEWLRL